MPLPATVRCFATRVSAAEDPPPCPKCGSTISYYDGSALFVCVECAHEWSATAGGAAGAEEDDAMVFKDASGNVLVDGDAAVIAKDCKVCDQSVL